MFIELSVLELGAGTTDEQTDRQTESERRVYKCLVVSRQMWGQSFGLYCPSLILSLFSDAVLWVCCKISRVCGPLNLWVSDRPNSLREHS